MTELGPQSLIFVPVPTAHSTSPSLGGLFFLKCLSGFFLESFLMTQILFFSDS